MVHESDAIRPRQVFCAKRIHYGRSKVAADVRRGHFNHAGISIDTGMPPDWIGANTGDEEWSIEWHKFYFGLDLAHAFTVECDIKSLDAWTELVISWIDQVPIDFHPADVAARRIQNWVTAWDTFARSKEFDGLALEAGDRILESLRDQLGYIQNNLASERNHRTLELYSLIVVVLSLPILDPGDRILAFARQSLHANLLADFGSDGVHREQSTHYHMVVLRNALSYRENARRFDLEVPKEVDQRLERACEFAMHAHRPDGSIPMLSDADSGRYLDLLTLAGELYSRDDFLFAGSGGARGTTPASRQFGFPAGGYFIDRSSWPGPGVCRSTAWHLIFDCGPLGDGGHGHYDALSFDLFASGRPLIVDPGRFTYSESGENARRWFKSTQAHNTVCVDGLDQTPYRRGKPKGPVAQALFRTRHTTPSLDVLQGTVSSPAYDAIHTRQIFRVDGCYWLVLDRLRAPTPHHYDLRLHFATGNSEDFSIEQLKLHSVIVTPAAQLAIWPRTNVVVEPGWISTEYGVRNSAPVLSSSQDKIANCNFLTLIAPTAPTAPSGSELTLQSVDFSADPDGIEHGRIRLLARNGAIDEIVWSDAARSIHLGPFELTTQLGWLRVDETGCRLECEVSGCHDAGVTGKPNGFGLGRNDRGVSARIVSSQGGFALTEIETSS